MDAGRFELLLDRYQSGTAILAETAELESLLRADPALRRVLAERYLLEVQLHKAFAATAPATVPVPATSRILRRAIGWLVAAMLLLGIGLGLALWLGRTPPTQAANDVLAGEVRVGGMVVTQVPEEARLEVAGDVPAVVRLKDRSQAELNPASQAVLHGPRDGLRQSVELIQGAGNFKVASGGGKFQVQTGAGTVSALGTEFSVKLQQRGKSEKKKRESSGRQVMTVTVTEGSVKVETKGKSTVLGAGETRTFGDDTRRREEREDDD
jgi:ferric-dicitrate binding protein FerR (iron transport regulator)